MPTISGTKPLDGLYTTTQDRLRL